MSMKQPIETPPKGRRSYNTRIDSDLIETAELYCERNKRAGNVCDVVERALLTHLKGKARKFRLTIPQHLLF